MYSMTFAEMRWNRLKWNRFFHFRRETRCKRYVYFLAFSGLLLILWCHVNRSIFCVDMFVYGILLTSDQFWKIFRGLYASLLTMKERIRIFVRIKKSVYQISICFFMNLFAINILFLIDSYVFMQWHKYTKNTHLYTQTQDCIFLRESQSGNINV